MDTSQRTHDALQEARTFQGRLALRSAGVTYLVWGLVAATTMLMYAHTGAKLETRALHAPLSILWIPPVLAGLVATKAVWTGHAFALGEDPPGPVAWFGMGGICLLFVVVGITAGVLAGGSAAAIAIAATNIGLALGMGVLHRGPGIVLASHAVGTLLAIGLLVLGAAATTWQDEWLAAAAAVAWWAPGALLATRG